MSEEQNKALVLRFVDELWNRRNPDILDEIMSTDVVSHAAMGEKMVGVEFWKQYIGMVSAAFPDLEFRVEDTVAEGDGVVLRWTGTGTHDGPMGEIPATGNPVQVTGRRREASRGVGSGGYARSDAADRYGAVGRMKIHRSNDIRDVASDTGVCTNSESDSFLRSS